MQTWSPAKVASVKQSNLYCLDLMMQFSKCKMQIFNSFWCLRLCLISSSILYIFRTSCRFSRWSLKMSKNFSLIHFKVKFTFQNNLSNLIERPRFPQIVPTSGSSISTGHPLHMDGQDDECVSDIGQITRFRLLKVPYGYKSFYPKLT